jgi:hypothetical protein
MTPLAPNWLILGVVLDKTLSCYEVQIGKDPTSWRNSKSILSWIFDGLRPYCGVLVGKNSVHHRKNLDRAPSQKQSQSLSQKWSAVKSESDQTTWAAWTFWWVDLSQLLTWWGLHGELNLRGDGLGSFHHRLPRRFMTQRWRLIPSRRSCCWGPSSSWMQIRQKPLPSAPAVNVLPLIAYHGATRDSCFGFDVCRTRRLTQETVDLY